VSTTALLHRLARSTPSRIVLLVLDGVGDLRSEAQPETALERARTPNLDALTSRSALGRLVPVATGVTPGSGPGHLALFGYEPTDPALQIGRGVLEALGLGLTVTPDTILARGNFATLDREGKLTDRRAGRIPTAECERLCARLDALLASEGASLAPGLEIRLHPGEGYRFVLEVTPVGGSAALDARLTDTDPQQLGVGPLPLRAAEGSGELAEETARRLRPVIERLLAELSSELKGNAFLLRGFSRLPELPPFPELYGLRAAAFAGYPLYRGVAAACGMTVVECGKRVRETLAALALRFRDFDFCFVHIKQTDMAGEDGDLSAKVRVLEEVDAELPALLALAPDVLAITADHSTPAPMKAHSWHPVPLLVHGPHCFVDETRRFTELEAARGVLGTMRSSELLGLLLANAGKLQKFGA
jgi:2,3-bisphosphoglycerate-independent phosphoglycerate mutase